MLSKNDKAYRTLRNIYSITDIANQTQLRELIENLVAVFTEFTGLANENDPTAEPLTPFRVEEPASPLLPQAGLGPSLSDGVALMDELNKVNLNLSKFKKDNKHKTNKIVDLEKENQILKDQITSKNVEVEKLKFELKNIKDN